MNITNSSLIKHELLLLNLTFSLLYVWFAGLLADGLPTI